MKILAPREWSDLLDILEKERGTAIVLGATDTGKSTLSKFLTFNLSRLGLKVALVDADIGQSTLGSPTTIGLSLFKSDPDWEVVLSPPEIFFVGSITPEGHFPIHLKGVKRMTDKAVSYGAEVIVVDTTGFVLGEAGRELKRRKIDLLSPNFILALQKSDEIEPILGHYEEGSFSKVVRLSLSQGVKQRSMEERKAYRTNRLQDYFKHSMIQELSIEEVQIEGEVIDPNGNSIPLDWALRINGLLTGLKDHNDETLALRVTRSYSMERKVARIFTPLADIQSVKTIQLSSFRVPLLFEDERA